MTQLVHWTDEVGLKQTLPTAVKLSMKLLKEATGLAGDPDSLCAYAEENVFLADIWGYFLLFLFGNGPIPIKK